MASSAIKDNPCVKIIIDSGKKLYLLIVGEDSCPFIMGLAAGAVVAFTCDRQHRNTTKEQREAAKRNREAVMASCKTQMVEVPKKIFKMVFKGVNIGIAKFKELKRAISAAMRRNMLKRKGLLFDSYPNITCKVTRNENGNIRAETITLPDKYVKQLLGDEEIMEALLELERAKAAKKKKCAFDSPKGKQSPSNSEKQPKLQKIKDNDEGEDNSSQRSNKGDNDDGRERPGHKIPKSEQSGQNNGGHETSGEKDEQSGKRDKSGEDQSSGRGKKRERDEQRAREENKHSKQKTLRRTTVDGKDYVCIPEDQVRENPDEDEVAESIRAEEDEEKQELKFERGRKADKDD